MSDVQPAGRVERRILGVGQLLAGLNGLLEDRVGRIWVVGEVSNLHRARSGHTYFTLKDDRGQIRAALFRGTSARLPFEIEEGQELLVYAEVSIYGQRGDLQLVVRALEPRGEGALQLAFEQLRRRLEAEGLFEADRKRPLPEFPRRIGVVTSETSAALRDVIEVSGLRYPATGLLVAPTRVQGEGAEEEIVRALALVAKQAEIDVILLVRGGGSLEDLWSFNTEKVARAIRACPVPVVCGVGHEVDVTIADWAADARAPTPSAAAALALPDGSELRKQLVKDFSRLTAAAGSRIHRAEARLGRKSTALRVLAPGARLAAGRARLRAATRALLREARATRDDQGAHLMRLRARLRALVPRTGAASSRLAALAQALGRGMLTDRGRRAARLSELAARLDSLSPLAVLSRGFALAQREDGKVVRGPEEVAPGERLRLRLARGELAVRADAEPDESSDS